MSQREVDRIVPETGILPAKDENNLLQNKGWLDLQ